MDDRAERQRISEIAATRIRYGTVAYAATRLNRRVRRLEHHQGKRIADKSNVAHTNCRFWAA